MYSPRFWRSPNDRNKIVVPQSITIKGVRHVLDRIILSAFLCGVCEDFEDDFQCGFRQAAILNGTVHNAQRIDLCGSSSRKTIVKDIDVTAVLSFKILFCVASLLFLSGCPIGPFVGGVLPP